MGKAHRLEVAKKAEQKKAQAFLEKGVITLNRAEQAGVISQVQQIRELEQQIGQLKQNVNVMMLDIAKTRGFDNSKGEIKVTLSQDFKTLKVEEETDHGQTSQDERTGGEAGEGSETGGDAGPAGEPAGGEAPGDGSPGEPAPTA